MNINKVINFMSYQKPAVAISLILIVTSFFMVFSRGLNFGIDFTGGIIIEAEFEQESNLQDIRDLLDANEFQNALVQNFGSPNDVLIRLEPQENMDGGAVRDQILSLLTSIDSSAELLRIEFVGPQVGQDLTEQGSLAMLFALIMIFIYVTFRFKWKFALGALTALVHDVIILIGFFALFQRNFDLTILAAVLATIGYSLNDTIVVYDRIRENFRVMRGEAPLAITNQSITQMLGRTIITSGTTLLVLLALFFLGGETVSGFALALIVGIFVGTYSSIFIACALVLSLRISNEDFMERKVEEIDDLP
ncbi:MAG: protein translocase subunit SecF [Proteobacteria bacterium]|jgi:preprotein translocase subunit SecF|nr:protein translocase subunit SecF [Pseudomonadota bacterium]